MTVPLLSSIRSIMYGSTTWPPLAMAPYAAARSTKWTPIVPSVSDGTATSSSWRGSHSRPRRSPRATTFWVPMSCCAFATGMFSEYFSASRTRTGPRSRLSAFGTE